MPFESERTGRERFVYDEGGVDDRSRVWHARARHVLECPNTRRGEAAWRALIHEAVRDGGRVLDVGCGTGKTALRALSFGATYVLGVDISERQLAGAWDKQVAGKLEFRVADVQEPLGEEPFDLVLGRSVLHHIDFRKFLDRIARTNLAPGGRMLWMEPLAHPLSLAFHRLVPSAHTPDEYPLLPSDLAWIRGRFPETKIVPINWLSFPAGVLSSFVFSTADNWLMRAADRGDEAMLRLPRVVPYARQGIIAISTTL